LKIYDRGFETDHLELADTITNFGEVYRIRGLSDKAIRFHCRALSIYERRFGNDPIHSTEVSQTSGRHIYRKNSTTKRLLIPKGPYLLYNDILALMISKGAK